MLGAARTLLTIAERVSRGSAGLAVIVAASSLGRTQVTPRPPPPGGDSGPNFFGARASVTEGWVRRRYS